MVIIDEDLSSSSSSPTSSTRPWKYHVFLSFRGEDTRNNFTGHLCSALREKGFITFMDDKLSRGDDISTALIQAIEESKISIVVFSKDYASSRWCLDELVKILDCKISNQQMVLPVFYKVDPSDIRNHRGSFGEGLASLECRFPNKVQEWKRVLSKAATLSGWPLLDEKCSEADIIQKIVQHISKELANITDLDVAEYLVGIEPRVEEIEKLIDVEKRDVHMVGIWGAGGIGKTTIAKAVYNSIAHKFEGSCFLENVREISRSTRGLAKLQTTLLCEILKKRKLKVTNVARGITMIKELQGKRVLLVLDDVNDKNQLNNLARECSWFGMGSRIIITTRDKKLLRCHGVNPNLIYEVQKLYYHEALELFSMKAFKRSRPIDDYTELTERAVRYAHGLPLALTVLGSSLFGGNVEQWEAALDGSESGEIKEVLKKSLDGLDHGVKEAFLDIACFFKCEDREHVMKTLEACGSKKHFLNVLIEKALISIDEKDCISMHDLIEEMGRDIVHEQSPDDPGNRSRLWFHEDVYRVLVDNIGTNRVRGIKVDLPEDSDVICLCATTFSNMKNLKLFIHRAGHFSGVVDGLPDSLKVIDWPNCPLQFLPSNTIPRELSVFHMPGSRITVLGDVYKRLINLTSINLSGCEYLTKVSDLSGIPHLETLDLSYCKNLVEVHPSVGFLDRLNYLKLDFCSRLETFPMKVNWKSMKYLAAPRCERLKNFIDIVHEMGSIKTLQLGYSGIKELHSWIGRCTSLEELTLCWTPIKQLPLTIEMLSSLTILELDRTPLEELPSSIGSLTSLEILNVSDTLIEELPSSIGDLISLGRLNLSGTPLKELPSSIGSITSLEILNVSHTLIEELPPSIGSLISLEELYLSGTPLKELPSSIGSITSLEILNVSNTLIEELPPSIGSLISLEELYLSGTPLKELPSSIGSLISLGRLYLSGTPLKELPSSIGSITSLEILNVSHTLIEELPPSIGSLISLEELYLSGTPLKELPSSIGSITSLRHLDASETLIEGLPLSIGNLIDLRYLYLRRCENLTNVPHSVYGGLQLLRDLYLSWCPKLVTFPNRLSSLVCSSSESLCLILPTDSNNGHDRPGSLLFPQLQTLNFEGCKLSVVSDFLRNLDCMSTLERLDLSGSSFDSLPACIGKFGRLRRLYLNDCKRLRDISELPANLKHLHLDDCNRLKDILGPDLVSKMAKSLLYQLVQAGLNQHVLSWDLLLPNLPEIEVPKWFDKGEVDVTVLPRHGTDDDDDDDACAISISIPRILKVENIGLVVCVIFEMTQDYYCEPDYSEVIVTIDEEGFDDCHYLRAKATELSAHDHVLVCLICIAFKELKVVDREVRVICDHRLLLKSVGVHLANMQENDDDHANGEYLAQERCMQANASISDFEKVDGAAVPSVVSDDSFTRDHEGEQEQVQQTDSGGNNAMVIHDGDD